jgi:hypothetical protein
MKEFHGQPSDFDTCKPSQSMMSDEETPRPPTAVGSKLLLFWLTIINLLLVASINLPSAREFIAWDCVHFGIGQISYLFARINLFCES